MPNWCPVLGQPQIRVANTVNRETIPCELDGMDIADMSLAYSVNVSALTSVRWCLGTLGFCEYGVRHVFLPKPSCPKLGTESAVPMSHFPKPAS